MRVKCAFFMFLNAIQCILLCVVVGLVSCWWGYLGCIMLYYDAYSRVLCNLFFLSYFFGLLSSRWDNDLVVRQRQINNMLDYIVTIFYYSLYIIKISFCLSYYGCSCFVSCNVIIYICMNSLYSNIITHEMLLDIICFFTLLKSWTSSQLTPKRRCVLFCV